MSAAQIGASLLAEVEELPLDELLTHLRCGVGFQSCPDVGLAEIDQLLQLFFPQPDPLPLPGNASFALSGNGSSEDDEHEEQLSLVRQILLRSSNRPKPPLIELAAASAGSESTDLCYMLTANAVINASHGAKGCCVVWLDTSIRFSVSRLFQICLKQLNMANRSQAVTEREDEAKRALKHVHVFSIQSSNQLLSTLGSLSDYLLQTDGPAVHGANHTTILPKHYSSHRQCSMIVLDSATAFHWQDRFDAEVARLETQTAATGSSRAKTMETTTSRVINKLKELQEIFSCTVVYTTNHDTTRVPIRTVEKQRTQASQGHHHHLAATDQREDLPPRISILPPPDTPTLPTTSQWTSQATISLRLTPIPTPLFSTTARHMTLEDCQRDRQARLDIVSRHRVAVTLNETWLNDFFVGQRLGPGLGVGVGAGVGVGMRRKTGITTGVNDDDPTVFNINGNEELTHRFIQWRNLRQNRNRHGHGNRHPNFQAETQQARQGDADLDPDLGTQAEEEEAEMETDLGTIFVFRCQRDGVEIER